MASSRSVQDLLDLSCTDNVAVAKSVRFESNARQSPHKRNIGLKGAQENQAG